ncbi:putative DNA-binding transcriptional regulator [Devosia equisanguinis]|uniref:Putative DNA-binding transcriptional regulator n=1 Tax=Devosia equisanguinis TaxID=2490941 RepID=A0A447I9T3_9HYPH|nr:TetR/AcrR family transcriptional regulator [Devosia equisanguinis]VDS04256.1 putative DNA-binding transcriptional regulator [Devosia equisanguinis]
MEQDSQKRESTDDRRAAIAAAARDLIVEKGLEGLRTRDIAARVGINIATLHYHVPSKEALIALVAQSIKDEFRAQGLARSRQGKNGIEMLHMEFEDALESQEEAPERIAVMAELVERARRDPAIAAIMLPMRAHWHGLLAAMFQQGAADGTLRADIDPDAAAHIFIGMIAGTRSIKTNRDHMIAVFAEFERAFAARPHTVPEVN